jgi:RHS repeat-associated protein
VTDSYLYNAFGVLQTSSGNTIIPFRYVGKLGYYYDGDLQQYYIRARYYNPPTSRFLSMRVLEKTETYVYVSSRALNLADPSGLFPWKFGDAKPDDKPFVPFPNPGDSPPNIKDDIADECILECQGSPRPKGKPECIYRPNIGGPRALLDECKKLDKNCSRITVGGHGTSGAGVSVVSGDEVYSDCFGCNSLGSHSDLFEDILKCFKGKLAKGGYLRICSCSYTDAIHQAAIEECLLAMAKILGAKVCSCYGTATSSKKRYCECDGQWVCR